jgi:menaquinone-dependent protoporphyrinogen oxidase
MSRILIAFASSLGHTHKVADAIAAELRCRGHEVELASLLHGVPPPVEDYDAVVLGSRVRFGKHAQQVVDYISANRAELSEIPGYFFSVSMAAANGGTDPEGYLQKLFDTVQWQPREAIAIAGAIAYRQYGFFLRWVMKMISRKAGHATDTSHNHEYTDWARVRRFAARIAEDLPATSADDLDPGLEAGMASHALSTEPRAQLADRKQ